MKTMNIKNIFRLKTLLLLAIAMLAACSSDDSEPTRTALTQNGITLTSYGVDSLCFEWEAVENVSQYGVQLKDSTGKALDGMVTTERNAKFTGLDANTTYVLELTPMATYGSDTYKNGEPKTFTAKTAAILSLATPTPTIAIDYEKISVTWDDVENADTFYVKALVGDSVALSDTLTNATSYTFKGTAGLAYLVQVSANSSLKEYSQSEWGATETVTATKSPKLEIWRVKGQLVGNGLTQTTKECELAAYDDGSYALLDFVNDGYDLEFTIDNDGNMNVTNGEEESKGIAAVQYSDTEKCYIYTASTYVDFNVSEGSFSFNSYADKGGKNTFTWDPSQINISWYVTGYIYDSVVYGTSSNKNVTRSIFIAYKDGSYKLSKFLGEEGYDLEFTPQSNGTLKINNAAADYGYCSAVEFYPGYYLYLYYTSTSWELDSELSPNEFWISAYYSSSGYIQFKWDEADVVKY